MKYDCALIQDILPLYADNALSEESRAIVNEHLSECGKCRELYSDYSAERSPSTVEDNVEDIGKVRKYSKRIKKRRIAIVSFVLVVFLLLASSFVSYVKFNTPNPIAAGYGLARVMFMDADYVEIQSNPRVVIARPDAARQLFLDTIAAEGYTYLEDEQLGALHFIERDGKREGVFISLNGYFSKWVWEQ